MKYRTWLQNEQKGNQIPYIVLPRLAEAKGGLLSWALHQEYEMSETEISNTQTKQNLLNQRYLSGWRLSQERGGSMYEAQAPKKKVGENHVIKEFGKER
jgi:hypothetical protein